MKKDESFAIAKGLRNEMLKFILLQHLSRRSGYPYGLMKAIQTRRVPILEGLTKNDLYNSMNSLEKQGFIKYKPIMFGFMVHKHYELTPKGRRILGASKKIMIKSLFAVKKIMEGS